MANAKARAVNLLRHYMKLAWRRAELNWNEDNDTEIDLILDAIEQMIDDRMALHLDNEPHIYADGCTS